MAFNEDQPRDERGRWAGGGGWTAASHEPMPETMRASLASQMYARNAHPVAGRQAWIALGMPAAGKSEHVEPIAERTGAHLVDPDVAKKMTPGYNGKNAANIHEYSSDVAQRVLERAVARGENVALPMVGRTPGNAVAIADQLHRAGYDVHVSLHDLPPEESVARAEARAAKPGGEDFGRKIPRDYIIHKVDGNPSRTYAAIKDHPAVRSYMRFDSYVPKGESPRLVEQGYRLKKGTP